ncbi:Cytochrome b [Mariprofundus ferrinatatus]|uniref:Cytochrome b n=1 Tax=Mariprofundus ferrinatatus TaxID=1921087 RepID=A0A2K8L4Z2_9PROT|nr:cytochrome b/b6 domain-containing protein [Mariprofundus ferrinatatus]ATX82182.1 Cytochrome b [Mariprofundus ferrinatatus]
MTEKEIQIWDPLIRIFHVLLITCFVLAWWFEDDYLKLHLLCGSIVLGLIFFRMIWGITGTPHTRFSDFPLSPRMLLSHLNSLWKLRKESYPGHTPAGSLMIITLLLLLLLLSLSGVAVYALQTGHGPLASWAESVDFQREIWLTKIHQLLADTITLLALLHVGGVLFESLLQKQNLALAMITGRKKRMEKQP